jgi:hypothetical protein
MLIQPNIPVHIPGHLCPHSTLYYFDIMTRARPGSPSTFINIFTTFTVVSWVVVPASDEIYKVTKEMYMAIFTFQQ